MILLSSYVRPASRNLDTADVEPTAKRLSFTYMFRVDDVS